MKTRIVVQYSKGARGWVFEIQWKRYREWHVADCGPPRVQNFNYRGYRSRKIAYEQAAAASNRFKNGHLPLGLWVNSTSNPSNDLDKSTRMC